MKLKQYILIPFCSWKLKLVFYCHFMVGYCNIISDSAYLKDKATVEMECMEEGYLAKILRGDGAKEIKVGEVLILLPIIFSSLLSL